MKNRACTVPKLFNLRKWFEKRFGDLCIEHDRHYQTKDLPQREADLKMFSGMVNKGYPVFGFVTYSFLRLVGWLYYKDLIK